MTIYVMMNYFTEYGVQYFTLENIRMSYGKRMTVPVGLSDKTGAKICSMEKKVLLIQKLSVNSRE